MTARLRRHAGLRWLVRLMAAVLAVAFSWLAGLIWYAEQMPTPGSRAAGNTEAVVVLTGGHGRLDEGMRVLAEGRARKLLISGVHRRVHIDAILRLTARQPDKVTRRITLGYTAYNTAGNARETAEWMIDQGYRSLRLVTSNYHMPRSLLEFRRAMPGFDIRAHAVFPDWFRHADWWRWRNSIALLVSEFSKYLVALFGVGPGRDHPLDRAYTR